MLLPGGRSDRIAECLLCDLLSILADIDDKLGIADALL